MLSKKVFKKTCAVFLCVFSLPLLASTETWDTKDGIFINSGSTFVDPAGNTKDINQMNISGTNGLVITGWSNTGNGGTLQQGKLTQSDYWGLMLQNQEEKNDTPNHSIDSFDTYFDMVLLSFEKAVDLTAFDVGWAQERKSTYDTNNYASQADLSIAAFSGGGGASFGGLFNTNSTWSSLLTSGWSAVQNLANVKDTSGNNVVYNTITSSIKSKYWLIGAYNPIFKNIAETDDPNGLGTGWRDGFKLASVQGVTQQSTTPPTQVPEPSTLAILGLGLLGLVQSRRKVQS